MLSFVWRNKKLENIHLPNLKKKKTKAEANSKREEGRRKTELKSADCHRTSPNIIKSKGDILSPYGDISYNQEWQKSIVPTCFTLFHLVTTQNWKGGEQSLHGLSGWAHGWKPMVLDTNILHQFLRIQMDQPLKNITWKQIKEGILSHILFHQMLPPTPWETET